MQNFQRSFAFKTKEVNTQQNNPTSDTAKNHNPFKLVKHKGKGEWQGKSSPKFFDNVFSFVGSKTFGTILSVQTF